MTQETSSHAWFAERISAYLTDGLDAAERSEFESHAALCAQCAAKLAEAKLQDETLFGLFETIGPAADFEDRVIRRLRTDAQPKFALPRTVRLHPMVMRAAGAAAAIIVLGALGYGGLILMENHFGPADLRTKVASNLRQLGRAIELYTFDAHGPAQLPQSVFTDLNGATHLSYSYANPHPDNSALGPGNKIVDGLQPTFGVAADINAGHEKQGQNVLYGNEHVDLHANPFVGTNRDNIYARGGSASGTAHQNLIGSPQIANDSILLPTDDEEAPLDSKVDRPQAGSPVAGDSARYSYQDGLNVPAPGPATFFKPAAASPRAALNNSLASMQQSDAAAESQQAQAAALALTDKLMKRNVMTRNPISETKDENPSRAEQPQQPAPPAAADAAAGRQIIRHGEMSFEVDSFDSAFLQITKIAAEEGGFVSDTDSEKLANGKMSGTISVRVPPDHLDTLTLKLRALGDLKGQKITADDVTKQYTDLQSELRAATAMENRLLDIIKTGKGEVKDLLAAEKEVGIWREKVEQVTGEINYFNNLISLSTLQISLTERDLRQAALASERETVDMGIETEDVEKARADAMAALDAAKARIIQADLKKLDAGQLAATITAEVSPEAAGPIVDHFKQLGRVARLNIDRQQTVADGATVPPGIKVQRLDTQLQVSIYNLANVAPRQTTSVSIACPDVETAYHAIISAALEAGGRVVDSSLNRIKPDQTDGVVSFESPWDKADAVLASVRSLGEVMHLTVTENPDAANVTSAKEGFAVTLASMATVAPREAIVSTLMPGGNLADAYRSVRAVVQEDHGNIITAQLQEQISQSDSANLIFDVSREHQTDVESAIAKSIGPTGRVISRQNIRSSDTEHTLDSKVQFNLTFVSADTLQPRETTIRVLAVSDVSTVYSQILAAAQQAGAKVAAAALDQSNPSNPTGQLDLIISRDQAMTVEKVIADANGGTISKSVSRSADLNSTTDEKVELRLTLTDLSQLPPRQTTTMNVQVSDPESALSDLQAAALAAGGHIVEQHLVKDDKYEAHLVVEVPLAKGSELIDWARDSGAVQTIERTEDQAVPTANFAQAKLDITFDAAGSIIGPSAGLWSGLKAGLGTSVRGLAFSLELVVIGICLALPWAMSVWLGWKITSRFRRKRAAI